MTYSTLSELSLHWWCNPASVTYNGGTTEDWKSGMTVGCILLELISPAEIFFQKNWEQVSIWVSFSSTQEVVEEVWGEITWCQINSQSGFVGFGSF